MAKTNLKSTVFSDISIFDKNFKHHFISFVKTTHFSKDLVNFSSKSDISDVEKGPYKGASRAES